MKKRSGAALVMTLSIVVLLTICILVFIAIVRWDRQSSGLTAAAKQAEALSRTAGNLVLYDILSEIRDGSTNIGTSSAVAYRPLANANMLPQRVLAGAGLSSNPDFEALYKQSASGAFYSGPNFVTNGPSRVSAIGSWEASRNGRVLSVERWNKPRFLLGAGFTNTNDLPRWMYFTRQESLAPFSFNPTNWSADLANTSSSNFVVGRAAYNVYEIGGCLDANVAGGPAGLSKQQLLASLAGASLTNIPAVTNPSAMVAWRNQTTGASTNQFLAYAGTNGLKAGFLDRAAGDRRFVGRQDLIAYASRNAAGGIGTNALPYLTHFSRGIDRPSVAATTNTSLLAGYPLRPAGINPAPTAVRRLAEVTLIDGTKLKARTPVAFRRFPLRRIGLLASDATALQNDTDPIYRAFGLYRSSPDEPWTYNHGAANRILTLNEVSALQREPDFFEMLQAAISAGSLGGSAGPYLNGNPSYATSSEGLDENIYRHVLQIGAHLIDQYDEDDFPTAIAFSDATLSAMTVYGNENLPYLDTVGTLPYRPAASPRTTLRGYLLFEVWNPHQNAVNADSSLNLRIVVTKGRVNLGLGVESYSGATKQEIFDKAYNDRLAKAYSYSGSMANFQTDYPAISFKIGSSTSIAGFDFSSPQAQAAHGILEFMNSPQLAEPFLLTAPDDPAAAGTSNYPPFAYGAKAGGTTSPGSIVSETTPDSLPLLDYPSLTGTGHTIQSPNGAQLDAQTPVRFAGIMVAEGDKPDDRADGRPDQMSYGEPAPGCWDVCTFSVSNPANDALTIELQVETPQGWRTYQKVQNIRALSTPNRIGRTDRVGSLPAREATSISFIRPYIIARPFENAVPQVNLCTGYNVIFSIDPRTARFTYILRDGAGPAGVANTFNSSNASILGNGTDWMPATSGGNQKAFGALAANIPNHESQQQYYKDPDGVIRRADGEERPEVPTVDRVYPLRAGYYTTADPGYKVPTGNPADRPLLLNRPFASVADMGYAFRDLPWKTLDFHTADSGDGGLLDYFCIEETALDGEDRPLRAGTVNPNTASPEVLKAIIAGTVQKEMENFALDSAAVQRIASSVRSAVETQPLNSVADLPRLADSSSFPAAGGKLLRKTEKEAFIRALAPVASPNVWNVLIDVVAQAGKFPPGANSLRDFIVQGEARYWIFAAIDRTTCQVLDLQYELVTE